MALAKLFDLGEWLHECCVGVSLYRLTTFISGLLIYFDFANQLGFQYG